VLYFSRLQDTGDDTQGNGAGRAADIAWQGAKAKADEEDWIGMTLEKLTYRLVFYTGWLAFWLLFWEDLTR
jgi:hypothetical protein